MGKKMAEHLRILILDDHTTFAQSLGQLVQQQQIAQAEVVASVPAALAFLAHTTPDLVLVDITLKQRFEGLDFIKQLHEKWPQLKAACLTMHHNPLVCAHAYGAGAWGYFTKTAPLAETFEGIKTLLQATEPLQIPDLKAFLPHFTPREQEILTHLATGASNKELARSLCMAEETAKVHMKTLLRKLNLKNRTQVAIFAYENGFWPKEKIVN